MEQTERTSGWSGARRASVALGLLLALGLGACTGRAPLGVEGSLARAQAADRSSAERVMALDRAGALGAHDGAALGAVRGASERMAWDVREPSEVRVAALRRLLGDSDAGVREAARRRGCLMLPTEPRRGVVDALCIAAAEGGWKEYVPSMVRSLAREWADVPDARRPETLAIARLRADSPLERVAFEVFAHPPDVGPTFGVDWRERASADAWDVLDRLDSSGAARREMVKRREDSAPARGVSACGRELRMFPRSGEELRWALALASAEHIGWWSRAREAAARGLMPAETQRVRHAEALRWASAHRPSWLAQSREGLLGEVRARLSTRETHRRGVGAGSTDAPESLGAWEDRLGRAELVHILALDDALADGALVASLFAQARMDREDTTTEYGGTLTARDAAGGGAPAGGFEAHLYAPRPAQRLGDERFVASEEMARGGVLALAHYHFHVQRERNAPFAGPSRGDLEYAARMGRTCVVFTSLAPGVMGVDIYTPEGVVLDLGEVRSGEVGSKGVATGNMVDGER